MVQLHYYIVLKKRRRLVVIKIHIKFSFEQLWCLKNTTSVNQENRFFLYFRLNRKIKIIFRLIDKIGKKIMLPITCRRNCFSKSQHTDRYINSAVL